jgi:hypothetical protein
LIEAFVEVKIERMAESRFLDSAQKFLYAELGEVTGRCECVCSESPSVEYFLGCHVGCADLQKRDKCNLMLDAIDDLKADYPFKNSMKRKQMTEEMMHGWETKVAMVTRKCGQECDMEERYKSMDAPRNWKESQLWFKEHRKSGVVISQTPLCEKIAEQNGLRSLSLESFIDRVLDENKVRKDGIRIVHMNGREYCQWHGERPKNIKEYTFSFGGGRCYPYISDIPRLVRLLKNMAGKLVILIGLSGERAALVEAVVDYVECSDGEGGTPMLSKMFKSSNLSARMWVECMEWVGFSKNGKSFSAMGGMSVIVHEWMNRVMSACLEAGWKRDGSVLLSSDDQKIRLNNRNEDVGKKSLIRLGNACFGIAVSHPRYGDVIVTPFNIQGRDESRVVQGRA